MIDFYNEQVSICEKMCKNKPKVNQIEIENFIDNDPRKISWSEGLKKDLIQFARGSFKTNSIICSMYRPFCKEYAYFDKQFTERRYQIPKIFPNENIKNQLIFISGLGGTKEASALMVDSVPNLNAQHSGGQGFPLYTYEQIKHKTGQFPAMTSESGYVKKDAITDAALDDFHRNYDPQINKEDIFYYVYGLLHSPEYKRRFEADLKKMLPRIPPTRDFWAFSKAGRELAQWHLNYENIEPYPLQEFSSRLSLNPKEDYRVQKMAFGRRGKEIDKTTIIYNSNITLSGIPLEVYDYVVNGKSALEWIMERYQLTKDKASQITNDPNDWSDDPRYILDLVKRTVRVSLETMKIVNGLPPLNERK